MTTVLELITHSLQDIGVLGAEETPAAADAARAFALLNNMISVWNTEELMIYNVESELFSYVAGQAVYTIGSGGNFDTPRPVKILKAYNRGNNNLSSQVDYPIQVTTDFTEYSEVVAKNIQTTLPVIMYDDGNYPLKNLSFWPVPQNTTYKPLLYFWRAISSFSSLTDVLSLPPAYEDALEWNLAIRCAIPFGRPVSPDLRQQATMSKSQIKRINYNDNKMYFDPALVKGGVAYNLYSFLSGV